MQLERTIVSAAKRHLSNTTWLALDQGKQLTDTQEVQVQSPTPIEREERSKGGTPKSTVAMPKTSNPRPRLDPDMCFKCNQPRHRSHQRPRRQMVNLIETEFEGSEGGVNGTSEDNFHTYDEGEAIRLDEIKLLSRSLLV